MTEPAAAAATVPVPGGRAYFALLLLILAVLSPLLAVFVLASNEPREVRGAFGALLLFGVPMVLLLAIVALVGQPAFAFIKQRIFGRREAPAVVGSTRYRIGALVVFVAILCSWLESYLVSWVPAIEASRYLFAGLCDALVLVGLGVLGGAFWDKIRALFVQEARVVPEPAEDPGEATAELVEIGWRFYAGVALLGCMVLALAAIPAASAAGWSTAKVASLTGIVVIANKVLLFAAIAVMGKSGFNHLKGIVGGYASKLAPAQQVSPARYQLGLILFMVPLFMTWIAPYVAGFIVNGSVYGFLQELALEVLIFVGLFLLGGEFWGKFRALFSSRARVAFPGEPGRPV